MIYQMESSGHKSVKNSEAEQMDVELRTDNNMVNVNNSLLSERRSDSSRRSNSQNSERETRAVSSSRAASEESLRQLEVSSSLLRRALECQFRLFHDKLGVSGELNSLYENAYMMLSPELQPISPATDIAESMRIFEEHKQLAQQYLQTRTEIECLMQVKEGLEKQLQWEEGGGPLRDSPRVFQELRELQSENVGLVQLHQNLKQQLALLKGGKNPGVGDIEPEPGWVMVPRR